MPQVSDIEIVAMSITMEAMSISSENLLYSKLKTDYPLLHERFPDRRNFNKRRRKLRERIDEVASNVASFLTEDKSTYVVDSCPAPICRTVRAPQLKILKEDLDFQPQMGYSAIDKKYYYGFKLHLLVSDRGTITSYYLTAANVHDSKMISSLVEGHIADCELLGDKGYFSAPTQLSLFETQRVILKTPSKKNTKVISSWSNGNSKSRKIVETVFSQLEDQFSLKRNYAKSFLGYFTRITSKIAAHTLLQYLNFSRDVPILQIKHALAI